MRQPNGCPRLATDIDLPDIDISSLIVSNVASMSMIVLSGPGHLLSKLYKHISVLITINLTFAECPSVFGDAKMTIALPDRLTRH